MKEFPPLHLVFQNSKWLGSENDLNGPLSHSGTSEIFINQTKWSKQAVPEPCLQQTWACLGSHLPPPWCINAPSASAVLSGPFSLLMSGSRKHRFSPCQSLFGSSSCTPCELSCLTTWGKMGKLLVTQHPSQRGSRGEILSAPSEVGSQMDAAAGASRGARTRACWSRVFETCTYFEWKWITDGQQSDGWAHQSILVESSSTSCLTKRD